MEVVFYELHDLLGATFLCPSEPRLDLTFETECIHPFLEDFAESRMMNADTATADWCVQVIVVGLKPSESSCGAQFDSGTETTGGSELIAKAN